MEITSTGINNGRIADRFGSKGTQFTPNGIPSYSIPFHIFKSPIKTISFAVVFDDDDSIQACGFTWIHWTICNLRKPELKENDSINGKGFIQGVNTWHVGSGLSIEESTGYGGCDPPDNKHTYRLKVFALDTMLDLEKGFTIEELMQAMNDHVITTAQITGTYEPK